MHIERTFPGIILIEIKICIRLHGRINFFIKYRLMSFITMLAAKVAGVTVRLNAHWQLPKSTTMKRRKVYPVHCRMGDGEVVSLLESAQDFY